MDLTARRGFSTRPQQWEQESEPAVRFDEMSFDSLSLAEDTRLVRGSARQEDGRRLQARPPEREPSRVAEGRRNRTYRRPTGLPPVLRFD